MTFWVGIRLIGRIHIDDCILGEAFGPDALVIAACGSQRQRVCREGNVLQGKVVYAAGVSVGRPKGFVPDVFLCPERKRGVGPERVFLALFSVDSGGIVNVAPF